MGYAVTVDKVMARAVAMGGYCEHCLAQFSSEVGVKACCTTCNNERSEAGLKPHANVRPREDELNVAAHINQARAKKARKA